jgi:hypothetical protein
MLENVPAPLPPRLPRPQHVVRSMAEPARTYSEITQAIKRDHLLLGALAGAFALWAVTLVDLIDGLFVAILFAIVEMANILFRNWRLHGANKAELARRARKEAELAAALAEEAQASSNNRRKSFSLDA